MFYRFLVASFFSFYCPLIIEKKKQTKRKRERKKERKKEKGKINSFVRRLILTYNKIPTIFILNTMEHNLVRNRKLLGHKQLKRLKNHHFLRVEIAEKIV